MHRTKVSSISFPTMELGEPELTVVTPSFNQREYIEKTIRSVSESDMQIQHIVVDGGSTDGSVEYLQSLGNQIELIVEPDEGQSDAINKGMKLARGKIVCWLNSDDLYLPGGLKKVIEHFHNNPNTNWLYGKVKIVNESGNEIRKWITKYKNMRMRKFSFARLLQENWIPQMGVFWRREFGKQVGELRIDLKYSMDYDLWLRFGKESPGVFLDQYVAAFRWYSSSKTGANYRDSFREAYELARLHSEGRYPIEILMHRLLSLRTIFIYNSLDLLSSFQPTNGRTATY